MYICIYTCMMWESIHIWIFIHIKIYIYICISPETAPDADAARRGDACGAARLGEWLAAGTPLEAGAPGPCFCPMLPLRPRVGGVRNGGEWLADGTPGTPGLCPMLPLRPRVRGGEKWQYHYLDN